MLTSMARQLMAEAQAAASRGPAPRGMRRRVPHPVPVAVCDRFPFKQNVAEWRTQTYIFEYSKPAQVYTWFGSDWIC